MTTENPHNSPIINENTQTHINTPPIFKGCVGCEIECLIHKIKTPQVKKICENKKISFDGDGSVIQENLNELSNYNCVELRGEGLIFEIDKTKEMFKLIERFFKRDLRINQSCGLHFHISFKDNANYFKLLRWDFINKFQTAIKELFKTDYEKRRLINHYCELYTSEEDFNNKTRIQTQHNNKCGGYRYNCVNFNSFNIHKTIEFRVFPAVSNIEDFKSYANFLISFISDYLNNTQKIQISEDYKPRQHNNNFIIVIDKHTLTKDESTTQQILNSESEGVN